MTHPSRPDGAGKDQRVGPSRGRPPRSILEGRSRTVVSRRTSVAKRGQIAVSDRRTLGGLPQFATQFGFGFSHWPLNCLFYKYRRDGRLVEGTRLDIDSGRACGRTPKHFCSHRGPSVCVAKSRCSTPVSRAFDTVLTQCLVSMAALTRVDTACPSSPPSPRRNGALATAVMRERRIDANNFVM